HILDRIEDKDGNIVWQAPNERAHVRVLKPAIAYEIDSCLTEALKEGTGQLAYQKYGLKDFPAAGKTGTAYDFTDALFAGYDSAITCVVWAGFDKPQTIYRGAFGSTLALPVWVDVMNASTARYTPREFPMPPTLHTVEICSKSGLLATDKCYENVKSASGDIVRQRTSYRELATKEQMPTDRCDVHTDSVRTQLAKHFDESKWPRAALAVDPKQVPPVPMQAATLIAPDDPYNAIGSTAHPKTVASVENTNTEPGLDPAKPVKRALPVVPTADGGNVEVRRAEPVRPVDGSNVEVRRAEPVRPMDAGNEPLLQAPTPPPIDFNDGNGHP
ncbi:MAG: hypothetical protein ACRD5Z_24025, partial [Bryobacteraceae bacterium]